MSVDMEKNVDNFRKIQKIIKHKANRFIYIGLTKYLYQNLQGNHIGLVRFRSRCQWIY